MSHRHTRFHKNPIKKNMCSRPFRATWLVVVAVVALVVELITLR